MSFLDDFYSQLFVQSWTMAIGDQAGTALVDMIAYWKKPAEPETDYYRVIKRGEIRNGWKLTIPLSSMCNGFHDSLVVNATEYTSTILSYRPPSDDESWPLTWKSIVFEITTPLVNGGQIHCIRQYSLIKPSASSTLLKIYSRLANQWSHVRQSYLNARTLMVLFQNGLPPHEYRVFLVNLWSKKNRSFRISPPAQNAIFKDAYLINSDDERKPPSLRLVFFQKASLDDPRMKVIDAKYVLHDLATYRDDRILQPSSIDSILFPLNQTTHFSLFPSGCPMWAMFYNEANVHDTDAVVCITFDRNGLNSINLTEWLRRYESTSDGRAVLNAAKAFIDLRPPSGWNWFVRVPAVLPLGRALVYPGFVLGKTDQGGIIRRWIRPPSMLQLAAEAIFRARPDVKLAEIEKATGVDVSDGMQEDGTEEDAMIVCL